MRNRIGHVVLNRPAARNALTLEMVRLVHAALRDWAADSAVEAVVFRGSGERAFCAGGDIRALWESYRAGDSLHRDFFVEEYALDLAIHRYRKPCIAIMDGLVLGGGMGISQGTVRRIVTERSRIGMPEVAIGFFPDVGGTFFLSRLPGRLGLYLALTGVQIEAADAIYCGLADRCMRHEEVGAFVAALDSLPWRSAAGSGQAGAELLRWIDGATRATAGDPPLGAVRSALDEHFSQPSVAAIAASLTGEARPEFQPWAKETLTVMARQSPAMSCVTFEALRRGGTLSLEECFDMELRLTHGAFEHGDFLEGVRALIVDKDRQPRWNPPAVNAVVEADVGRFFAARG